MQEVTFDLQVITPLFMAGADQTKAELRAPSFRGEMRYWYRSSLGNIVDSDTKDMSNVIATETSVFGATDKGSAIQVRVHNGSVKSKILEPEGKSRASATGRDYLFWSVQRSKRPYIPQQTSFQITLSARSNSDNKRQGLLELERAISAFWLLTHLGSVGSRSRRCAGSLSVTHISSEILEMQNETLFDFPFYIATSIPMLKVQLETGISKARELAGKAVLRQKAFFDTLAPNTCRIWILRNADKQAWTDANQALRDIGKQLQSYRDTISPVEKRKIFGIPIMVLNDGRSTQYQIRGTGKGYKRMASPIHLRLSELHTQSGKQYVGIATLFKTRWENMPETDYKLYELIEKWIEEKFPAALEVRL